MQIPSDYILECLTNVNGKYQVELDGVVRADQQWTNYTYYTDGDVNLDIKIRSRNRDNHLSSPAESSITSPTGLREFYTPFHLTM